MNQMAMTNETLRRALEALRNGVPNRDAVRVLGCSQNKVTDSYKEQLDLVDEAAERDRQAKGLLIAGDFGSGKSHLLEFLKHIALEQNFVCSLIVISKETPIYDPAKVYLAAAEAAVASNVSGDAIKEIALRLNVNADSYGEFFRWANSEESGLASFFPATMLLHERLRSDQEMLEEVRGFWAGEKLPIARVREGLRQIGQSSAFQLRNVPAKDLPLQRFKFAARLIRAAGYRGWVILVDEVELIGRYSRLQRAKSYAEIARWMGRVEADQYPGLTTVAAITNDFADAVLYQKGDRELVGPFLLSRNTDYFNVMARLG